MRRARFDIEANGLLDATKVHCLSVRCDGEVRRWIGNDIPQGLAYLDTCDVVVGHNAIGYDLMVLWKLYRWTPKAQVVDTLTLSCLVHPDISGGHSLDEWGKRLGCPKTDYLQEYITWRQQQNEDYRYTPGEEWVEYNPIMGDYCNQDVLVLEKLDNQLTKDMEGWAWAQAVRMEHQFAKDFARQAWRGVYVDKPHAVRLLKDINEQMLSISSSIEPLLPERDGLRGELKEATPPKLQFKKNGEPSAAAISWFDQLDYRLDDAGMSGDVWSGWKFGQWHRLPTPADDNGNRLPIKTKFPMSLKDQQALKAWLMDSGWVPTMWSYKKKPDKNGKLRIVRGDDGQPVVSQPKFHERGELCANLEAIQSEFEHVNLVVRWLVLRHRRGFVNSVLEHRRDDGTVPATGMALGTPTSRVTHAVVANVPKADPTVILGKECRQMFRARPGRILAGVDASGLELRCLAHYANNPKLVEMVLADKDKGELDIHTVLAQGYAESWSTVTRSSGKNVTYALLYGASDKKVGQTCGAPDHKADAAGAACREVFLKRLPGMDGLMQQVTKAAKTGYIKAVDGRKIPIRSPHAALNTLLQSCGSILVKWAQCYMNAKIIERRLDSWQVVSYHDEVVLDSHPVHAEQAGQLFIEGLQWAGKKFGFRCPLSGELHIGESWADVH